ncbi:hypothetical protein AV530_015376 [Patagioenas fasciata monilis]|uniref:Uncharacterized protein n=1 Tax=Patagioenas fasciata monilis TaxID=372326 RepID=A0A1V4JH78_PATFA|nr:hypothetical protein AV530_015376 [Patagioenas fasciata monilis]
MNGCVLGLCWGAAAARIDAPRLSPSLCPSAGESIPASLACASLGRGVTSAVRWEVAWLLYPTANSDAQ